MSIIRLRVWSRQEVVGTRRQLFVSIVLSLFLLHLFLSSHLPQSLPPALPPFYFYLLILFIYFVFNCLTRAASNHAPPHPSPRLVCLTVHMGAAATPSPSCVGHICVCLCACVCLHWAGPLLLFPLHLLSLPLNSHPA